MFSALAERGMPFGRLRPASMSNQHATELTITRPDDWHLHLRDGGALEAVVLDTARQVRARHRDAQPPPAGDHHR